MTFEEWLKTVPIEIINDTLWHMEVYRFALERVEYEAGMSVLLDNPPMP